MVVLDFDCCRSSNALICVLSKNSTESFPSKTFITFPPKQDVSFHNLDIFVFFCARHVLLNSNLLYIYYGKSCFLINGESYSYFQFNGYLGCK